MRSEVTEGGLHVCLDVGITQTRAWLRRGGACLAQARTMEGIRSGFVSGSSHQAVVAIDGAVAECLRQAGVEPGAVEWLAAAGMVTSELGPYPVAHLDAPGGLAELAAGIERREYRGVVDAPLYLVAGIRFGALAGRGVKPFEAAPGGAGLAGRGNDAAKNDAGDGGKDAMRGEETLVMGLLAEGLLEAGEPLLNLGSHWKLVGTDASGRITDSFTGLGGEMIFAVARESILKGSLPAERPEAVSLAAVEAGRSRAKAEGLGRALFQTRMDAVRAGLPPDECYWQVAGAVIGDFLPAVVRRAAHASKGRANMAQGSSGLAGTKQVGIAGFGPLAQAWAASLEEYGIAARLLTAEQVDAAFCAGLERLVERRNGAAS